MNGWDHVLITTIAFIVGWIILQVFLPFLIPATLSFWLLLVAWIGGIFPDFDNYWKPLLGHRSILTHSIIVPILLIIVIFLPVYFFGWWTGVDFYIIAVFILGCVGHFFLDLAPSSRSVLNRFLKNPLEAFIYIEKGLKAPPGNITYVPKKYEKGWLIGNGAALIAILVVFWFILPLLGL
ncbi:MAG: hypothetical protein ACFFD8_04660 [Candidatus Thorarchaeota archaeon]